jgi:hypothetical protein
MSDESKTPEVPEEATGSGEDSSSPEGTSAEAPSPSAASETPAEGEPKKTGGFDFLTVLLVVVVLLNVVFFLYNSYADKPPADPTGGPPRPPAESPVGQAESPPPPANLPLLEDLSPEEEVKVILKGAEDFDFKNPRLLMALMALNNQPEPVGLSRQQKQRFLVEFAAKRLDKSVDSIVATLLSDVFERLHQTPGKGSTSGSAEERLNRTAKLLTDLQAKADPALTKVPHAREVGNSQLFSTVDEACVALLDLSANKPEVKIAPGEAAYLLLYLHPILAAGTPPLTDLQQDWIKKNQGTKNLAFETYLVPLGRSEYDDASLSLMQDHVRSILHESK